MLNNPYILNPGPLHNAYDLLVRLYYPHWAAPELCLTMIQSAPRWKIHRREDTISSFDSCIRHETPDQRVTPVLSRSLRISSVIVDRRKEEMAAYINKIAASRMPPSPSRGNRMKGRLPRSSHESAKGWDKHQDSSLL